MTNPAPTPSPFLVTAVDGGVEAWSAARLPFEPRGEALAFRTEIRDALAGIPATAGSVLHGTYTSADDVSLADTENILFYNVGMAPFRHLSMLGMGFARVFGDVPAVGPGAGFTPLHHHRYSVADRAAPWQHWRAMRVLATWENVLLGGFGSHPELVWRALTAFDRPTGKMPVPQYYGMHVRLAGTGGRSLAPIMKSLLDGIISSFHGFCG